LSYSFINVSKDLHVTEKFVASVKVSLAQPEYCFVIFPIKSSPASPVKISNRQSHVQQGPNMTQQGPLIVNISDPLAS